MKKNEETLRDILFELLEKDDIELTDSLKDLGVDSLQMVILIVKIETIFDIEIPDENLDIESFETVENILNMINQLTE